MKRNKVRPFFITYEFTEKIYASSADEAIFLWAIQKRDQLCPRWGFRKLSVSLYDFDRAKKSHCVVTFDKRNPNMLCTSSGVLDQEA